MIAIDPADWRCQTCGGWEVGHITARECLVCRTYRYRTGLPRPARLAAPPPLLHCQATGCGWAGYKGLTRGLCRKHYQRARRRQRQEQAA